MEGDQNVDELSKERSAKLVKTWPYVVARYAHVTLARDHVRLCNTTKTTHFQYYRACPSTISVYGHITETLRHITTASTITILHLTVVADS